MNKPMSTPATASQYLVICRGARLDENLSPKDIANAMKQFHAMAAFFPFGPNPYRGLLHGVPIAVKDLFWTKGFPTAARMAIYKDYRPDEDATVVRRLKEAGAVLLGKLQLTEGAYSDHHPFVTPPKNPWNSEYWPGISSSGAGVATAAHLCYGSLGSDTGGSIRWPCAALSFSAPPGRLGIIPGNVGPAKP
jgi:Asp-tRNA(Asn)/Glu-tRNA(Gln) amidotransferase A subunit family amidase